MKLRRTISIILAIVLLSTMAVVAAQAADTTVSSTGAYVNRTLYEGSSYVYSGDDLGATYTKAATTWKVWSPAATKVQVKLYKTGSDREMGAGVIGTYDLTKGSNYVWSLTKSGDFKNVYYTYLVTAKNNLGQVVTNETQDVYSKAVGVNGNRSMVVDLASTNPEGWENDKHVVHKTKTTANVWELHIRDFSADPDSGVSDKNRGTYLAFTEGGTTYKNEGNFATCMDYLVENNINTVQLMPFADFDGTDEVYGNSVVDRNWGYNPKNYNVPDGSYSSNAYDGNVRINEVKQMVQALHDRGISVVMDVVYNHTAGSEGSCFTKTVPGYYYRMASNLAGINGSGQGNELASDKAMVRNFIVNSLKYWVNEYHIDGFRFDLMACMDVTTLSTARTELNKINNNILLYGEPWIGGSETGNPEPMYENNASTWAKGVGGFSGNFREAASYVNKDRNGSDVNQGWIGGATTVNGKNPTPTIVSGIKGNNMDSGDPTKTVNYVDCHDNLTLWDKLVGAYTKTGEGTSSVTNSTNVNSTSQENIRKLKLGGLLVQTSQGVTFMLAGTEFARTKQGQCNSYNSPDYIEKNGERVAINMLDWKRVSTYKSSVDYYKGLRQINEVYSPFSDDGNTMRSTISFLKQSGSTIGYTINNTSANIANGEWGKVAVLMNAGSSATSYTLSGTWDIVADADNAGVKSLGTATGSYSVPAHSGAILVEHANYKDLSAKFSYATLTTNHYLNGSIVKTVKSKYRVGTTYRALKDASLLEKNVVSNTEGTVSGTISKDVTVNYYYEPDGKTTAKLTVQYIGPDGSAKLTPDMVYTLESGDQYSVPVCTVQGYQLNTDKYPAETTGVFDGKDKTIKFVYKNLSSSSIIVHYYKSSNISGTPCLYAYTDDGIKPLGDWDATSKQRMSADSSLGANWYTKTVPVPSANIMFHEANGNNQEPGQNEPGYVASGEVFIKDRVMTITPTLIISHINVYTGKKVKADEKITEQKLSTDQYQTSAAPEFADKLYATPANASGFYTAGTTNIVYLYEGEKPTEPQPSSTTEPPKPTVIGKYILGDSNCDGTVNINDVTIIQQHLVNLVLFDSNNIRNADVDGSGTITIRDANYIQRYLAKMTVPYDINKEIEITAPTQATQTTQASSSSEDDPFTEPDTEEPSSSENPQPDYMKIVFSNNLKWSGDIYCYYWMEGEAPDWPGEKMTYKDTNEYDESRYTIELPVGCNVIFTNGSEQTDDFEFSGEHNGFYASPDTVTVNGQVRHVCGAYDAGDI